MLLIPGLRMDHTYYRLASPILAKDFEVTGWHHRSSPRILKLLPLIRAALGNPTRRRTTVSNPGRLISPTLSADSANWIVRRRSISGYVPASSGSSG
jgi:hypothetical protein